MGFDASVLQGRGLAPWSHAPGRTNFTPQINSLPSPATSICPLRSLSHTCTITNAYKSDNGGTARPEQAPEHQTRRFKGTYEVRAATAPSDNIDSDGWRTYPLTAHNSTGPFSDSDETWPTPAARAALYSNVPVHRVDAMHVSVQGQIPTWLKGSLYRNGPGSFQGAHAVFDGLAMLARFAIDGSTQSVVVSHRFIETTYFAAARAAGGDVRFTLGHEQGVKRGHLDRLKYIASLGATAFTYGLNLGDNALISIFPSGVKTSSGKKELIAHTETLSGTYRIDPDTLKTLGRVEYSKVRKGSEDVAGTISVSGTAGTNWHGNVSLHKLRNKGNIKNTYERDSDFKGPDEDQIKEILEENVSGMVKTAHPYVLPNGDVINLACDFMPVASRAAGVRLLRPPNITVYRHPGGDPSLREVIAHIPYLRPTSPTWVHQPAVTDNYAVIVQNPCFYDIEKMVFGESGEYLVFKWDPAAGSLIHVVPLHNSSKGDEGKSSSSSRGGRLRKVKSFRAPAFLATHWINAFEDLSSDGRFIHLDGCITEDPRLMAHWALDTVRSGAVGGKQIEPSYMRRLTLDLDAPEGTMLGLSQHTQNRHSIQSMQSKDISNNYQAQQQGNSSDENAYAPQESKQNNSFSASSPSPLLKRLIPDESHGYALELPSINPAYSGKPHRFVYAASARRPSNCWNALAKADIATGTVMMWHETGAVCWEPIFCPRPGAVEEDAGCVLCVITQADGRAALLVLDGQKFVELGRAVLPYGLPNGFHGCFVPDEE